LHHNQAPSQAKREDREIVKLAQSAIGQHDVRLSALHMAAWTATIVNGGNLSVPRLIDGVTDPQSGQKVRFKVAPSRRVMSAQTARALQEMMEGVVDNGTGKPARVPGLRIGGKTGTPETGTPDAESNHAIFIAYGGVSEPQVAVAVVIEGHRGGGKIAGPLAAEMIRASCRHEE
jgi:peptidoglycan glycosyltransferase